MTPDEVVPPILSRNDLTGWLKTLGTDAFPDRQTRSLIRDSHEALRALVEEWKDACFFTDPTSNVRANAAAWHVSWRAEKSKREAAERLVEERTAERDGIQVMLDWARLTEEQLRAEVTALRSLFEKLLTVWDGDTDDTTFHNSVAFVVERARAVLAGENPERTHMIPSHWETPRIVSSTTIEPLEP